MFKSIKAESAFSLPLDITGLDTKLEPTRNALNEYYTHTEQEFVGGYFPVGANTTWHGGIHLEGAEGMPVHAMADGVVVCARMPAEDSEKDKAIYGSRNFALVRHGKGDKSWYSLYYHLKSLALDSEEAEKIAWLSGPAFKLKTNVNIRNVPKDQPGTKVLRTAQTGEVIEVISADEGGWYWVFDPRGQQNGYMKYSPDWMDHTTAVSADIADKLSSGSECYQIERPVKAGDIIGYVGKGLVYEGDKIAESNLIHWQVFSPKLLDGGWEEAEDADADYQCNSQTLVKLIDENRDAKLTRQEIADFFADQEKAKAIRRYACKFQSEWSVEWNSFANRMNKEGIRASSKTLTLYNFWDQAAGADSALPDDGKVWHYNPIAFLEKQMFTTARARFAADAFEPDRTLPLPHKIAPMLSAIGSHLAGNRVANLLIAGHATPQDSATDLPALSKMRADSLKWVLSLDKEAIAGHIKAGHWGNRERKHMLAYMTNAGGASYYRGAVDDTADGLDPAVRAFQEDNGLAVDGIAGRSTFTKMFELILSGANVSQQSALTTVGCGDAHNDGERACAGEIFLWDSSIEPAVSEYESDSRKAYATWISAVNKELTATRSAAAGDAAVRIELVVDPEDPDVRDDEYLLVRSSDSAEIRDEDIVARRTVKDDAVSGDQKLTLEFSGLTAGETYELLLRRDGEDYIAADPFVWNPPAESDDKPLTITFKAAIRELDLFEAKRIGSGELVRNERLVFLKNRWVYVFARKAGGRQAAWLDAEYWFDENGKAHPVNLKQCRGMDQRKAHGAGRDTVDLKARLNGDSLRLFIAASPFQLNWNRIQELSEDPSIRCYDIGTQSSIGTLWFPDRLDAHREFLEIANAADPNLEGIEKDTLCIGVRDLLHGACEANAHYCNALNTFLENRFDTSVKDDGKGNITLQNSDQQARSQLEQLTAGLVIHALTGGRDNEPFDEMLMKKCLKNSGDDFKAWLSNKMHAHARSYAALKTEVHKLSCFLTDTSWEGVEADIASMTHEKKQAQTAFDYLSRAINRLDEIDMGRDLLVKHVKGKHPVLNEESGMLAKGSALHKDVDSYVKVVGMLAKMYAATPRIDAALKKKRVFNLFEKGLDVKLNTITEKISRDDYLEKFDNALAGKTLEFDRFEIDIDSARHLKALDDFDAVMDKCGAVLDGLSLAFYINKFSQRKTNPKDHYDALKSTAAILVFFGKSEHLVGARASRIVAKRAGPAITTIFAICDAAICSYNSYSEFSDGDFDASAAKATGVAGNLLLAAGTVLILFPPTAALGLAGVAIGTILTTGGDIWHTFADDNETTFFLKRSPWGIEGGQHASLADLENNKNSYLKYLSEKVS